MPNAPRLLHDDVDSSGVPTTTAASSRFSSLESPANSTTRSQRPCCFSQPQTSSCTGGFIGAMWITFRRSPAGSASGATSLRMIASTATVVFPTSAGSKTMTFSSLPKTGADRAQDVVQRRPGLYRLADVLLNVLRGDRLASRWRMWCRCEVDLCVVNRSAELIFLSSNTVASDFVLKSGRY